MQTYALEWSSSEWHIASACLSYCKCFFVCAVTPSQSFCNRKFKQPYLVGVCACVFACVFVYLCVCVFYSVKLWGWCHYINIRIWIVFYCIVLYCIVLYCIVLYCKLSCRLPINSLTPAFTNTFTHSPPTRSNTPRWTTLVLNLQRRRATRCCPTWACPSSTSTTSSVQPRCPSLSSSVFLCVCLFFFLSLLLFVFPFLCLSPCVLFSICVCLFVSILVPSMYLSILF